MQITFNIKQVLHLKNFIAVQLKKICRKFVSMETRVWVKYSTFVEDQRLELFELSRKML